VWRLGLFVSIDLVFWAPFRHFLLFAHGDTFLLSIDLCHVAIDPYRKYLQKFGDRLKGDIRVDPVR
jgi:hypothetical protein